MTMSHYKVTIRTDINMEIMNNANWYGALKNIYNRPGSNFDGYVSKVCLSDSSDLMDSITIYCYTVEGPEEAVRLSDLKDLHADWNAYRKEAITSAIFCYAYDLGCAIEKFEIEDVLTN